MGKKSKREARKLRHRRLRNKVFGTPERPRLNIYRSLSQIYAQLIDDMAGHTLVSASTIDPELRPDVSGLSKTEQAKIVGERIAERAKERGIEEVVFDRGGFRYMGRVRAVAEGARKGGLKF